MTARRPAAPVLEYVAEEIDQLLAVADAELASSYRGEDPGRQPVHTVYIPAHRFEPDAVPRWGADALAAMEELLPGPAEFADAMGLIPGMAAQVRPLVLAKLSSEPIEDLRIDFEDGYGIRSDATEDADARTAARSLAAAFRADAAPSFTGLRCKSLEPSTRRRAIGTLDAFLGAMVENGRPLPDGFVITLPKVTSAAQVSAMAMLCDRLEAAHGPFHPRRLQFEIQVETPQLILGPDGIGTIARCVHAAPYRLLGLHYGTYDYSASLGIAAAFQSIEHPAADHARAVMQVAAAGTGVRLSDGSSNVLPVGGRDEVLAAWRLHARLVRRSLERGFYQGWDSHPGQLVSRFAATYAFFREGLTAACERLMAYSERAAAGLEEPATARALAGYLIRALDCGATSEDEVAAMTGLHYADLRSIRRRGQLPPAAT
ncbi:MAG TPA: aldolase/citrate lyase family protein [Streptosporangiaceae bacterium]|nr:aldolase/citrate lyase family protein [Streptosporangiaceae bacterium]